MKEGKSKEAATKIAGKVASEKMKGAGSGPTAKQKARMKKSPSKMKKSMANMKDKSMAKMKKSPAKIKGEKKVERLKNKRDKQLEKYDKAKNPKRSTRINNRAYKTNEKYKAAKEKSPAKKPLVGKQKNLPEHLKKAILDAPAKMLSKSGMKMMKEGSPAKELKIKPREERILKDKTKQSSNRRKNKVKSTRVTESANRGTKTRVRTKEVTNKRTGDVQTKRKVVTKGPTGKTVSKSKKTKNLMDDVINMYRKQDMPNPAKPPKPEPKRKEVIIPTGGGEKSPTNKTKKKVEQDYARNAIADYKAGKKKEGNYEKKKALELAAGESGVMMKKSPGMMKTPMMKYDNSPALIKKAPTMMKTNQMGGGVAAKDSAAPAKQLKKLGSIISKHMKSN
jgi:hypothetical protein